MWSPDQLKRTLANVQAVLRVALHVRINWLLVNAGHFVESFLKVIFNGQKEVVEGCMDWARGAMVLVNVWHGCSVRDSFIDRVQSLVLSHVLVHLIAAPG